MVDNFLVRTVLKITEKKEIETENNESLNFSENENGR